MFLLGELAALGTSVCWSFTSVFFTLAGRVVGSGAVNRIRLLLAIAFLAVSHVVLYGELVPLGAAPERWLWLGLSGIVGLVIGDAFLFQAFVWIGPRLSMLLMALVPVISTLLAWLFLGEVLNGTQILAIVVTVGGVAWVILDRSGDGSVFRPEKGYLVGILFGLAGATGQAVGLIMAKKGLAGEFSALSGTLIRMIVATFVLWAITVLQGHARETFRKARENRPALRHIVGGAFFGPFLGVSFSLVAVQATEVGIASTLMSLAPVFLLPISRTVFGERFSWRAIAGTLIAILGVTLLLSGSV
jgi:drug/metabolite transporter (DMT)-like permease